MRYLLLSLDGFYVSSVVSVRPWRNGWKTERLRRGLAAGRKFPPTSYATANNTHFNCDRFLKCMACLKEWAWHTDTFWKGAQYDHNLSFFLSFDLFPLIHCRCRGYCCTLSHSIHTQKHRVGLLWTRYRAVAQTSTWQHTSFTRERHHALSGIRNHNRTKWAAAETRLWPRGYQHRL